MSERKLHFYPKVNLVLKDFPVFVKDPKNYEKIYKTILDAGVTNHSHSDIARWGECLECQNALWRRKETMKRFGFLTAHHWRTWNKIMAAMRGFQKRNPITKHVINRPLPK